MLLKRRPCGIGGQHALPGRDSFLLHCDLNEGRIGKALRTTYKRGEVAQVIVIHDFRCLTENIAHLKIFDFPY